jgi:fatty-acyl-CoA synthase
VLYNVYGSTEVAVAAVATPADLGASPGTVGRPVIGVRIRILDEQGEPVPRGHTGRVFVGSSLSFDGYTDAGTKEIRDGYMSTGDIGRFDSAGRLFIEGREDDMVISGGENVFPLEVEECLSQHPAVADAAVVGVEDEEFGQRLSAFVVPRPGTSPTVRDMKEHVSAHLARFKVPRDVCFVDVLPRNAAGKVVKRELG